MQSKLNEKVQEMLQKFDKEYLGGLTDNHIKWLKVYCLERFGNKNPHIIIDIHTRPKDIRITPITSDGKIININLWLQFQEDFLDKDQEEMPGFLGLNGWRIRFARMPKKEKK